jgi:4-hydroxy-3-polyprenylbenzoate decarboxylase
MTSKRIILAITGASGTLFALEFLKRLNEHQIEVHAIISDVGRQVMEFEIDCRPEDLDRYVTRWHDVHDFTAPMASGSSLFDGMAVLPCTMGSLAAIAGGISNNLIHRAADVMLKEKRPLLLAVRETPLSRIHLQNMLRAQEAGAIICPPMPALYHRPRSLQEMAAIFAGRLGGLLGIELPQQHRWTGMPGSAKDSGSSGDEL